MKKLFLTAGTVLLVFAATFAQHVSGPALDSLRKEKDTIVLQNKLTQLAKGNEQEMSLLITYFASTGNETMADSITQLAIQKFPSGSTAYSHYLSALFSTHGGKDQEELFLANKGKFPYSDLDTQYFSVGVAYAIDKDRVKMNEYGKKIKDPFLKSVFTRISAGAVMKYDAKAAEQIAKTEAEALYKKGVPEQEAQPTGRQQDIWRNYLEFMALYANILTKNSKYQDAYKYAKAAYDNNPNKSDQLKGSYGLILGKTGRYSEAFPILNDIISAGRGNEELKSALKESYSKLNPGKDASAFMAQTEKDLKTKIEEELKKILVTEDAPNFFVKDINGNTVSLADLKGKTIVLDFWATWCGPCKASFPAMQSVVNAYRDNPNVKILFVHTWENNKEPMKAAQNYLNTNNYKFDLYMDLKDPITNTNPAVTAFGVKGIPAKFVIDGNGKIRFKKVGFDGADDAAVAELGAMIDMVRGQ
jgi:thiol-disulfide isomerase/thioredoxin